MVEELLRKHFQVLLICPKDKERNIVSTNNYRDLTIKRIPFSPPRLKRLTKQNRISISIKYFLFLIIETLSVWRYLRQYKIENVLVRHNLLTLPLPLIMRLNKVKAIADGDLLTETDQALLSPGIFNILSHYEKIVIKYYSFFKVSTMGHRDRLMQAGVPREKILLSPVSLNLKAIPRPSLDSIPKHTFGYFGVLEKWQGVDILISAFKLISQFIPSATLYIIGDGSLKEEICNFIQQHNLSSKIILVNSVPRKELWKEYFNKFRITIIPRPKQNSSTDTVLPIKLIESLAAGKPTIVMDLPVMRELPNNSVFISNSATPEGLFEAMKVMSNDESLQKKYSESAILTSSEFEISNNIVTLTQAFLAS